MPDYARLSRSDDGRVKLEYSKDGKERIALWEPFGVGVFETIFDKDGAVLFQNLLYNQGNKQSMIEGLLKKHLDSVNIDKATRTEYTEVKLKKKCPGCGAMLLERVIDLKDDPNVPVMPIYVCSGCKTRSYYLSDAYLEHLLKTNESLFSQEERSYMDSNKTGFVDELKEYIIRIFASKRIMRIK